MKVRDHQRAIRAHAHVLAIKKQGGKAPRQYGTMVHRLPILVHTEGLAAALHFVMARGDAPKRQLLDHLAQQLVDAGLVGQPTAAALLEATREASLGRTQVLTREVQRCLYWYKSFVKAELKVDAADEDLPDEDA